MLVHKGNYRITGLILFAIFLRPGYYIWRAHVLGRKKLFPVLYTVIYVILIAVNVCFAMYGMFYGMIG